MTRHSKKGTRCSVFFVPLCLEPDYHQDRVMGCSLEKSVLWIRPRGQFRSSPFVWRFRFFSSHILYHSYDLNRIAWLIMTEKLRKMSFLSVASGGCGLPRLNEVATAWIYYMGVVPVHLRYPVAIKTGLVQSTSVVHPAALHASVGKTSLWLPILFFGQLVGANWLCHAREWKCPYLIHQNVLLRGWTSAWRGLGSSRRNPNLTFAEESVVQGKIIQSMGTTFAKARVGNHENMRK